MSTTWTEGPGWFFRGGDECWGERTHHFVCSLSGDIYRTNYSHNEGCYFHSCVAETVNPPIGRANDFINGVRTDLQLNPEAGLVHVESWLWDSTPWLTRPFLGSHPGSAPVSARVTATPEVLFIDMGDVDGTVVACEEGGTPWAWHQHRL